MSRIVPHRGRIGTFAGNAMPTLETERLLLRPLSAADLKHMQRYSVREDFYRYLPLAVPTADSVADYLDSLLAGDASANRHEFQFAIEPKAVGHIAGSIRIRIRDAASAEADVGYGLDSRFGGRGFATEALRAVLRFGFEALRMQRIQATTDIRNEGSWRLLERTGFRREGLMRDHMCVRGTWRDSWLYALPEAEWRRDDASSNLRGDG